MEVKYTLEIKLLVKIGTSECLLGNIVTQPDKIIQLEILSVATRFIEQARVNQRISIRNLNCWDKTRFKSNYEISSDRYWCKHMACISWETKWLINADIEGPQSFAGLLFCPRPVVCGCGCE